jgi:hypothetical protein
LVVLFTHNVKKAFGAGSSGNISLCKGERILQPGIHLENGFSPSVGETLGSCLGPPDGGNSCQPSPRDASPELEPDVSPYGLRNEPADKLILHADEETSAARITLPGGSTEELSIDPSGFMTFRGDDM